MLTVLQINIITVLCKNHLKWTLTVLQRTLFPVPGISLKLFDSKRIESLTKDVSYMQISQLNIAYKLLTTQSLLRESIISLAIYFIHIMNENKLAVLKAEHWPVILKRQ